MCTTTCESTVNKLQNLVEEWASQFENKPPIDLQFQTTANNLLIANGIVLGPASEINAEGSTYDEECLYIATKAGSYYEIYLDWSYNDLCRIGYIQLITPIYCAVPTGSAE